MKRPVVVIPILLALLSLACSLSGWDAPAPALPTPATIDPTLWALETQLAQPPATTAATATPAAADTAVATDIALPTATPPPTANPAACLFGTWQATNIQDYVVAAIPPDMAQEYNPTYQSTSGQAYLSFFENGLVTLQAYQLNIEFEIQAGIFRVGLVVALDGLSSGQYSADASQVTTQNMTTTGLTASARALEQDVISPAQILASLPLVQPPFHTATYQCDAQTLSLRLNAYPATIPPLQFQHQP
jgi:hypothetical protein